MESIINDPNGRRRIQFVAPDGSRKSIRLGKIDRKSTEAINRHVEALLSAKISGQPLPRDTAAWITTIGEKLSEKLFAVGLVEAASSTPVMLLGTHLDSYMAKKTDIKPASLLAVEQVVRNLKTFFGVKRNLATITAGDAEDFSRWLATDARARGASSQKAAGLSPATVAKRLQRSSAIFRDAVKRKLIAENPFAEIKQPRSTNPERQAYIQTDVIEQLIESTSSAEWRLLLAMSRYLGVRVPSEPVLLQWDHIDWESKKIRMPSPKTARYGKPFRIVPILPQIKRHLEEVYQQAPEESVYVFENIRARDSVKSAEKGFWMNVNLRQELTRIMARAGIKAWPKLWQNLRSSAQTDLANRFPVQVVCAWLGNTKEVAKAHYLQVTEDHFEAAQNGGAFSGAQVVQNQAQQVAVGMSKESQPSPEMKEPQGVMQSPAASCDILHKCKVAAVGFETSLNLIAPELRLH